MRLLLALLLLAGCRAAPPAASGPGPAASGPDAEGWAFEHLAAEGPAPSPGPRAAAAPHDTSARGPRGEPVPADSFRALVAAVDGSSSGAVALVGGAGDYHDGEVTARAGERWQGLYPAARGVEVRSFRLGVETVRDRLLDDDGAAPTGVRVTTPFSALPHPDAPPEGPALVLVRRPGAPFPARPATALAGAWPVERGALSLRLGARTYQLEVTEGPERAGPDGVWRTGRVLVLSDGERRQPVSVVGTGDGGGPAVLWAGDLDGDGRLDLLVDETTYYYASAPALFLSSEAAPGALVRRVGAQHTSGC